jgi:hypothetical protein
MGNLEAEALPSAPPMRTNRTSHPTFVVARPWRALVVAVLALATLLPATPAPPAAAAAGRPKGPLVPSSGFYVGAYTKHIDGYGQQRAREAMDDLETRLGRRLHINHHFYSWTDVFPSWREPYDLDNGRIPMISWNGENTDAINSGEWDWMIASRAQSIAMLNTPVFIRWFWEMDGTKKEGFISSPASYQKAFRHIVDIFRTAGASNAVWVWCPNASAVADGDAMPFYPGAGYVDWVCGDGYNFAPNRPGDEWETFPQIYNGFYAAATKLGKPIMIGEFGVLERKPGEKEQWFRQAHDWIQAHPAVAAVVYFNADSTTKNIYYDWRLDTSPSAFEGFRYLFDGTAPVKPSTMEPGVGTNPPTAEPAPAPATPQPKVTTKPAKPRTATPAPAGAGQGSDAPPVASSPARAPSPRLTWVLEMLRQLDAASVAT